MSAKEVVTVERVQRVLFLTKACEPGVHPFTSALHLVHELLTTGSNELHEVLTKLDSLTKAFEAGCVVRATERTGTTPKTFAEAWVALDGEDQAQLHADYLIQTNELTKLR